MTDLQLLVDEKPSVVDVLTRWALRVGVALLFVFVGWTKFPPHGMWVGIFEQIGFGQWFRVFTGVLQVGGAALVLVPRTAFAGAAILSCTMLGAALTQLFILHTGLLAILPAVLMVITAGVAAQARGWI